MVERDPQTLSIQGMRYMNDPLGLSIGTANLVAVRAGESPVTHPSVLTLHPHRAPEVGEPTENSDSTDPGRVVRGFVQCIGDSTPLVTPDGSTNDPDLLLVEAIDAMVNATGADAATSQLAIAVPAHWQPAAQAGLQDALATHTGLSTLGGPAHLVPDTAAALAAVNDDGGLPNRGVIALLDFGASGTSMTLVDTGSGFAPIDHTRRYREFSGDRIDDALLAQVVGDIGGDADPGTTAAVGQLTELRQECTYAKEQLSVQQDVDLVADLGGSPFGVRVTRTELEKLIEDPLSGLVCALEDLLERNTIRWSKLAAVVAVGGGASIPLISQRLSSRRRAPVITSQHPAFDIARGAVLLAAARGADEDATTRAAPSVEEASARTAMAAAASTSTGIAGLPVRGGGADGPGSPTLPGAELAWSQEEVGTGDDVVPYAGDPYTGGYTGGVDPRPAVPPPDRRRGSGVPRLIFGASALVAVLAIGGVAYTLANSSHTDAPTEPTISTTAPAPPPPPSEPPSPTPIPPPPAEVPSISTPEPPPEPPPPPPPPPAVTTTVQPAPTTTTTPSPTPTTTTTTTPTTTTTTTTPPPTTTTTTTTSSAPAMTTDYLTIPFVPVPIPVQVPENQAPPPQNPFVNPGGGSTGGYP